jgi:hypothetical protein
MRKLILTSYGLKTGEREFREQRLVVVNQQDDDTEQDLLDKAVNHVNAWFPSEYPESELQFIMPHATIGEPDRDYKNIDVFTRKGLIEFGQFVMNEYTDKLHRVNSDDVKRWESVR